LAVFLVNQMDQTAEGGGLRAGSNLTCCS